MSLCFHGQTGTVKLYKKAVISDLLYCVYGGLEMGRHDSFAHKALHPSSWIVVFVRVPRQKSVT